MFCVMFCVITAYGQINRSNNKIPLVLIDVSPVLIGGEDHTHIANV